MQNPYFSDDFHYSSCIHKNNEYTITSMKVLFMGSHVEINTSMMAQNPVLQTGGTLP